MGLREDAQDAFNKQKGRIDLLSERNQNKLFKENAHRLRSYLADTLAVMNQIPIERLGVDAVAKVEDLTFTCDDHFLYLVVGENRYVIKSKAELHEKLLVANRPKSFFEKLMRWCFRE